MSVDVYLGAAWTLIACGVGFIAALAWRGTRPEPPPPDYDEFTAPDYPPGSDAWEMSYDAEADALYLGLRTGFAGVPTTLMSGPGLLFDVVDGEVVSMEVLGASHHPIFRQLLPQISNGELLGFNFGMGSGGEASITPTRP